MTVGQVGISLCVAAVITSCLIHVSTFLMIVPGLLVIVPFFLLMGATLCGRVAQGWNLPADRRLSLSVPKGRAAIAGCILLVYAILLFVHFYKNSGGASGVGIVDGQYVYMYKQTVIREISENEYKMFPTQVARIMSAWIAMMATFCLSSLFNQASEKNTQNDPNPLS